METFVKELLERMKPDEKDMDEIAKATEEAFKRFDRNKDGSISRTEA